MKTLSLCSVLLCVATLSLANPNPNNKAAVIKAGMFINAKGQLKVHLEPGMKETVVLSVSDEKGNLLFKECIAQQAGIVGRTIDMKGLVSGNYTVKITKRKQTLSKTITIEDSFDTSRSLSVQ